MSSRNALLSVEAREKAAEIFRCCSARLLLRRRVCRWRAQALRSIMSRSIGDGVWRGISGWRAADRQLAMLLTLTLATARSSAVFMTAKNYASRFDARRAFALRRRVRTFFRTTLRENGIDPAEIDMAAICSVAPDACIRCGTAFESISASSRSCCSPGEDGLKIAIAIRSKWGGQDCECDCRAAPVSWQESADRRFRYRDYVVRSE